MSSLLIAWLISLPSVFLVGWAWGRSGRRVVVVNFPERPALNELKPTAPEVASAMRAANRGAADTEDVTG